METEGERELETIEEEENEFIDNDDSVEFADVSDYDDISKNSRLEVLSENIWKAWNEERSKRRLSTMLICIQYDVYVSLLFNYAGCQISVAFYWFHYSNLLTLIFYFSGDYPPDRLICVLLFFSIQWAWRKLHSQKGNEEKKER